jgi:tripartite-type tricarboxylate transporter receptor subunit TctC
MNTVSRRHLLIAAAAATLAAPSSAQTFPSRPVRLVVPYPPGGPLDLAARALAEAMRDSLGTVIVENRSGAGGNVGADHVAKSPADGYSLLIGAVATHAINPSLYPRMPYDAERDFAPISLIAVVPNVLVLNEAFAQRESIRTVDDFVAVLRRRPGAFQFASGGNGSAGHLAGELFKQQTQTFAVHIPYRGAGPAQLALMSGEVQFMFDNLASAAPRIREGRILPLGLTTVSRTPAMPELAPLSELSPRELKGFDLVWSVCTRWHAAAHHRPYSRGTARSHEERALHADHAHPGRRRRSYHARSLCPADSERGGQIQGTGGAIGRHHRLNRQRPGAF